MRSAARTKTLQTQSESNLEQKSFSSRIYGFDWHNYFPLKLADNEEVRIVDFVTAMTFINLHHTEIFETEQWGNPFFQGKRIKTLVRIRLPHGSHHSTRP